MNSEASFPLELPVLPPSLGTTSPFEQEKGAKPCHTNYDYPVKQGARFITQEELAGVAPELLEELEVKRSLS